MTKRCASGCSRRRGRSRAGDTGDCRFMLDRRGEHVNHKRMFRVYREAGLTVRRRARKRLGRVGSSRPALTAANQEWALDFVHDATASGQGDPGAERGGPVHAGMPGAGSGHQFRKPSRDAGTGGDHRRARKSRWRFVATTGRSLRVGIFWPGASRGRSNWCTSNRASRSRTRMWRVFNGKLRDECLNASWFANLFEARRTIAAWQKEYNEERPHSSLGYQTPADFAREISGAEGCGKDGGFATLENASRFPLSHSHGGGGSSLSRETITQQNRPGSEGNVV